MGEEKQNVYRFLLYNDEQPDVIKSMREGHSYFK